jgi:hypothetical protein
MLEGNKLTRGIPSLGGMASLRCLVLTGNAFTTMPYDFFHELSDDLENGQSPHGVMAHP